MTVDVGNTQTQLAVFDGDELLAEWRVSTARDRTADELGTLSRALFAQADIDAGRVTGIVLASVVPPLTTTMQTMGWRYFGLAPLLVTREVLEDLPVRYEPPGDVGADRLVNAVAVRTLYRLPAVVVDFGTATTFDVVDTDGTYIGGVIATGVGVSADALFARAARLPRVDVVRPPRVVGGSTVESVRSGLFYGYAELVDGLLRRIAEELEDPPVVIATGGWAKTIGPECERIEHVDELLTVQGLRLIHERYS